MNHGGPRRMSPNQTKRRSTSPLDSRLHLAGRASTAAFVSWPPQPRIRAAARSWRLGLPRLDGRAAADWSAGHGAVAPGAPAGAVSPRPEPYGPSRGRASSGCVDRTAASTAGPDWVLGPGEVAVRQHRKGAGGDPQPSSRRPARRPDRWSDSRTVWISRRIPNRSMGRHDPTLVAKQLAVTRRSPRS